MTVDHAGNVYVSDPTTNKVQKFAPIVALSTDRPGPPASGLVLHTSIPNPMRDEAVIRFQLPRKSAVGLRLYDVRGRLVRAALVDKELPAGEHQWIWDGRNDAGSQIGPGVYFVRLLVEGEQRTTKSIVLH